MHERDERVALLLLSGGSLVGQNVVQALGSRRSSLRLLATNSTADEPSLQDFDGIRLVTPTSADPGQLETVLVQWLETEKPALVVPCRDDDVVFLARLARKRPELAPRLLCGSVESALAMLDKWESWEFAYAHGLPFAPCVVPVDAAAVADFAEEFGFPLIVKPRSGFASRRVALVLEHAHLDAVLGRDDMLVQKYLGDAEVLHEYLTLLKRAGLPLFHSFESSKLSIQALIGPDGTMRGIFTTRNLMRQGVSAVVERDESDEALMLGRQCVEAFSRLGWRGPLNIQCQRDPEGVLGIYEFNGRFTGATAARTLLGFDEVGLALEAFGAVRLAPPAFSGAKRVTRQPASRIASSGIRESLVGTGVWLGGRDHACPGDEGGTR